MHLYHGKSDIIVTDKLSLSYGSTPLISNMNLHIRQGEFIGILGPNGSGKSTFLRALLGLVKPVTGKIKVLHTVPRRGNKNIGYMPQMRMYHLIGNLSGRALLQAVSNGTYWGLPWTSERRKKEIQAIIDLVEIGPYVDRPFRQLSGGERQRIYLAQALLGKPRILLLDEPLSNLDPRYQDHFIILLKEIQRNLHVTVLLTAHDPNPLLPVMSRVLFIANGKVAIGDTEKIMTSEKLSSLYGTPIEVIHLKDKMFVLSETQQNILGEVRYYHD